MTDQLDLQVLRRLDAERTPGEWHGGLELPELPGVKRCDRQIFAGTMYLGAMKSGWVSREQNKANAAAIVAAVNAIGPLIERVRWLEAKIDKLELKRPWITES